jgi:outer membrane murein-binding lipoprotein Lpp
MRQTIERVKYLVLGALLASLGLWVFAVTLPHTFSPGQEIKSAEMNENFQALKDAVDALEAKVDSIAAGQKAAPTKAGVLAYALVYLDGGLGSKFNPTGRDIRIDHPANGEYHVTFEGVNLSNAVVLVSGYEDPMYVGTTDNACYVREIRGETVKVLCYDLNDSAAAGTPEDTDFVVLALR